MKRLWVTAIAICAFALSAPAYAFHPADETYGYVPPTSTKRYAKPASVSVFGTPAPKAKKIKAADFYADKPSKKFVKGPKVLSGGGRPSISPLKPATVAFPNSYGAGTIVIDTAGRRLYYVKSSSSAYSYPVAVGRAGFTWTGTKKISRKVDWPDWRPPAEMLVRKPELPEFMEGGRRNPLGAKALYLGSTLYRIHGTNDASTIGTAASSGCFRMTNGHVTHLASIAGVGTTVIVKGKLSSKIAKATKSGTDS